MSDTFDYDWAWDYDNEPDPILCDYCGKQILFKELSNGKFLPIDPLTHKPHECDFSQLLEAS